MFVFVVLRLVLWYVDLVCLVRVLFVVLLHDVCCGLIGLRFVVCFVVWLCCIGVLRLWCVCVVFLLWHSFSFRCVSFVVLCVAVCCLSCRCRVLYCIVLCRCFVLLCVGLVCCVVFGVRCWCWVALCGC